MPKKLKVLIVRPFYGVNINGDMAGDFGVVDYRNWITPDLSLIYSASLFNTTGHQVDVIDANSERWLPDYMFEQLSSKEYDYIFVKMSITSIEMDIKVAEILKRKYQKSVLIAAGHSVKILNNWINNECPFIDICLKEPMEDYVYRLCFGETSKISVEMFPTPDYSLFPYKAFKDEKGRGISFLWASRGCKYTCSYCPYIKFYESGIDERSIPKIMEDLYAMKRLEIEIIQFRDPFFTANKERTISLCKEIVESQLEFEIYIETRIDSLDSEVIDWLEKAGCSKVFFGVESADHSLLKKYKRPTYKLEKAKKVIAMLEEKQIKTLAFYIIGFPEEKIEQIELTFKLALELKSTYAQFNVFSPYPYHDDKTSEYSTPQMFTPFENRMNTMISPEFSPNEIELLAKRFDFMYHMQSAGLSNAYYYEKFKDLQELRGRRHISNSLKKSSEWWH